METIILGSGSPRRKAVLKSLNIPFEVIKPQCNEDFSSRVLPSQESQRLVQKKMQYLIEAEADRTAGRWILCADTVVYTDQHKMGKAKNIEEAKYMLSELSGKSHQVSTSLLLRSPTGKESLESCVTEVHFKKLDDRRISFYLENEDWKDAAGAYKIQSLGDLLIDWINGSFSNVMGLPIALIYDMIHSMAYIN